MIEGHEPNPELRYVVTFSGGKDSVATWLYLTRDMSLPNVTCLFANTNHESEITYQYLEDLRQHHGLPLESIQPTLEDFRGELVEPKIRERMAVAYGERWLDPEFDVWSQPLDMERLAVLKRRFPSTMARFCTIHLKVLPMARWMKQNRDLETILVTGVRAQESLARAGRETWTRDEPTGCMMWLPIHKWTHEQVFECHRRHGVPPNPLYRAGMSRVGCWPCIMCRKSELATMARRFPEAFDRLEAMEQKAARATGKPAMSFFSNHKTPERFHSETCDRTCKSFPSATDVKLWALGDEPAKSGQAMLFEDDWTEDAYACTSQYGLCE